jgi:hypothetical protein
LWRRFFQLKDLEEKERTEEVLQTLDEEFSGREFRPISAPEVVQARQEYVKDYYRTITVVTSLLGSPPWNRVQQSTQNATNVAQIMSHPNLDVPVGDRFKYLPQ